MRPAVSEAAVVLSAVAGCDAFRAPDRTSVVIRRSPCRQSPLVASSRGRARNGRAGVGFARPGAAAPCAPRWRPLRPPPEPDRAPARRRIGRPRRSETNGSEIVAGNGLETLAQGGPNLALVKRSRDCGMKPQAEQDGERGEKRETRRRSTQEGAHSLISDLRELTIAADSRKPRRTRTESRLRSSPQTSARRPRGALRADPV